MTGKKKVHLKWDRELTRYLSKIKWCELCKSTYLLDRAHRLKRRFIGWRTDEDRAEYFAAAILCRKCHAKLDEAKDENAHQRMFELITKIILRRLPDLIVGDLVELPFIEWDPVRIYTYAR